MVEDNDGLRLAEPQRTGRCGSEIIQQGLTDTVLYEKVAGQLKAGYAAVIGANHVDEMAWLCKPLAASGNGKFAALL